MNKMKMQNEKEVIMTKIIDQNTEIEHLQNDINEMKKENKSQKQIEKR